MDPVKNSIAEYAKAGLLVEILDSAEDCLIVKITQKAIVNGLMLNQKELVERVKSIYDSQNVKTKVVPVTYSLDRGEISLEWILEQMETFKINRQDLVRQLALSSTEVRNLLTGSHVDFHIKTALYYYFLNHRTSRERESL